MKNYLVTIFLSFLIINIPSCKKSTQNHESETIIKGWKYIGGDEFNNTKPDTTLWFRYGDGKNATYGRPQGMIQTYRPQQVEMTTLPSGEKVLRITSVKRNDGDSIYGLAGWWSGAISTRETEHFFPLYCKIDVRAKVANEKGVWHAIWSRYRDGASIAELDLNEFFVKKNGKGVVSQAIHLWNSQKAAIDLNLPQGQNRNKPVADPSNTFHTYSVQIDKDPNIKNEAIITLLVDGGISYSLHTADIPDHNKFILDAIEKNRLDAVWDIVITGQIGATNASVDYPDPELKEAVTEIDWVRVYVRE